MRAEAGGESDDRGGPEGDQAGAAAGGGGRHGMHAVQRDGGGKPPERSGRGAEVTHGGLLLNGELRQFCSIHLPAGGL